MTMFNRLVAILESPAHVTAQTRVRAILDALREPTPDMIAAGEKEFFEHLPDARDWTLLYTKEAYREMIDAIQSEAPSPLRPDWRSFCATGEELG